MFVNRNDGLLADLKGIVFDTVLAGETKVMDWVVEEQRVINGFKYVAHGCHAHDKLTTQLLSADGLEVLRQFSDEFPVFTEESVILYKGNIYPNLIFRVIYESAGSEDVIFSAGLYLHKEKPSGS